MFTALKHWYNHRCLKDLNFSFLFAQPPENEVVCFDCETTGLDPKKAEILSIGAVVIKNNRILTSRRLELFIKPTGKIGEESIKIHHLRHVDLENGLDVKQAIIEFMHFIGSRPLVGYYLEFDVAMVNKYVKSILGIRLPNQCIEVSGLYYDKKQKHIPPYADIDLRFDNILRDLSLPTLGQHDAYNDALMTALMYVKLQNLYRIP